MHSILLAAALMLNAHAGAIRASASATSVDEEGKHIADLAFDGLMKSGWGSGSQGKGEGSWLEIDLGSKTSLTSLSLWPGNLKEGAKSYREYSRPRLFDVYVDGAKVGDSVRVLDKVQRVDVPLQGTGSKVRIQFLEVYEGFVFNDMYVAEACVNWAAEVGRSNDKVEKWAASPAGQKAREAFLVELNSRYESIKAAEFGNAEALDWIMDATGDGAPYLRPQVNSLVSGGFRAAYIQPDPDALSTLRKLKDANSIPAIEMAALRVHPDKQAEYKELVEIFYAWQQLIGGPDPNVPYWGKTGWADGAIQSFGEPVPVALDRFGLVLIADIGNNRVQRFAEDGRPEHVWGPKADIANAWFGKGRPWYVSGAAPGTEKGQFWNPLDVEILPEKDTDSFAVLDAKGRVQIFDPEGVPRISWKVRSNEKVEPALGGEGYLAWLPSKKRLYVFWGDEAIGFNLQGEEVTRWEIKDGTPNAVTVDKKGRFLLAYRDEIIRYDLDGFRYGVLQDEKVLLPGFEDVDIAVDEKGKLWVVIDTGWAFKFKKPGKLEYKVEIADWSMEHPRFAVRDDMLYVCERDRILRIDARKLHEDQVLEAKKAKEEAAQKPPIQEIE